MRNHRVEQATAVRGAVFEDDDPLPGDREAELRAFGRDAARRRAKGHEVGAIRRKLQASAAGHLRQAAAQVSGREREHISDSDYQSFRKALDRAITELDQESRLAAIEPVTAVVNEPGPYGADSPNSYYADLAVSTAARLGPVPDVLGARVSSDMDMSPAAVEDRLQKHCTDVALAVQKGGEYGKRCRAILTETWRTEDPTEHRQRSERELRAFGTGSGPGTTATAPSQAAAFVSPAFLLDAWAPYRSPIRTFADQCATHPLPSYGMEVYVPIFTSADKASEQTEGGAVTETVPATGLEGAAVKTISGQLLLTEQWRDRMNTGGGSFDEVISQEMNWRLDERSALT